MSQYEGKTKWCAGQVQLDRGGFYPCSNRWKHEEDGKLWCGTHLPSRVAAKREARMAKLVKETNARDARWKREARIKEAEWKLVECCLNYDAKFLSRNVHFRSLIEAVRKARA